MTIVTWNVLHRIHAVNWDDEVVRRWPDETARIAAITEWVAGCDADVICLQEVSGDQLTALRALGGELFAMRYPRTPRYRRHHGRVTLADSAEYLASIVRGGRGARMVSGEAFADDGGKGFQVIELVDHAIVNLHASFGDKLAGQLAAVRSAIGGAAIVCGDFNADRTTCGALLDGFAPIAPADGSRPTRPRTASDLARNSQTIDHVFARGMVGSAEVLDGGERSDHNPVRATITRQQKAR